MKTTYKTTLSACLMGLLLPLASNPAAALGFEKPMVAVKRIWPGLVTINWIHTGNALDGDAVWWYRVERESPFAADNRPRDTRMVEFVDATPNRATRYRVCAVYNYNEKCSNEDGVGYTSLAATTPVANIPQIQPLKPLPFAAPAIRAQLVRTNTSSAAPYVVRLTWLNPPKDPVQWNMLESIIWHRADKGQLSDRRLTQIDDPRTEPGKASAYYLCVRNPVHQRCSNTAMVLPVEQTAPGNLKPASTTTPAPGKTAINSALNTTTSQAPASSTATRITGATQPILGTQPSVLVPRRGSAASSVFR